MQTLSLAASTLVFSLAAAAGHARAPIGDLGWLAGRWCADEGGERVEEQWLSPARGELLGVSRTLKDGRMASFEFLRIGDVGGVPTYLAQPGGRPPTAFPRIDGGEEWVRFENTAHDFPQRIEYRRDGDDLVATIAGPGDGGKRVEIAFRYRTCSP